MPAISILTELVNFNDIVIFWLDSDAYLTSWKVFGIRIWRGWI